MPDAALQAPETPLQLLFALRYDGEALHGTAQQAGVTTAAGLVLARIARHLRPTRVWALSVTARLDAGVHAHFNLLSVRVTLRDGRKAVVRQQLDALEAERTDGLCGLVATPVPFRLSARGLARRKTYRYVVEDNYGASATRPPWIASQRWRVAPKLDAGRMRDAAQIMVGEHDFTAFAASPKRRQQTAAQAIKHILRIEVAAVGTDADRTQWHIDCEATGLLRRQMRFMVAGIVCAGAGLLTADALAQRLLAAAPPEPRAPQAPAWGLYLMALHCPGPASAIVAQLRARLVAMCAHTPEVHACALCVKSRP